MMLRYSLGCPGGADRVEAAVATLLDAGHRTPDLGGTLTTREVGDLLLGEIARVP
jgi:3-isopropylmalate dehydrogenase